MPVAEVRESQMSIMTIDNHKKSLPFLRSEKLFRAESHFATVQGHPTNIFLKMSR